MGKAKNPTVSVIIPTYNRAHLVGRAIRSVLNQTYQDFELIVVDDASTDNTEEVIRSFDDNRIRYIRHDENKGAAAARNTGIRAARGWYIAFQDSDDEWMPTKLEKQIKALENAPAKVGVVYTDMWRIYSGKKKYWHSPIIAPQDGIIYEEALDWRVMGIGIGTAVIKRECFDRAGLFDERLPRYIDFELFVRLSKYCCFYQINEPLVNYYASPRSISFSNEASIKALMLLVEKYFEDMDKKSLAKYYYLIGHLSYQNGNVEQGRSYLVSAVRLYPLGIKYLVAAFTSLFGVNAYNKLRKLKRKIYTGRKNYEEL